MSAAVSAPCSAAGKSENSVMSAFYCHYYNAEPSYIYYYKYNFETYPNPAPDISVRCKVVYEEAAAAALFEYNVIITI